MRNDLTDLTLVLDRSGSMRECLEQAQAGLDAFVAKQQEAPGECNFTVVQFDDVYEFVCKAKPVKEVTKHVIMPRGWTALLDAVGKAIAETGERIGNMAEADRPGLVVFVILTDGKENVSKEYTKSKIKEMIQHQIEVYKWQFTFLGADQDAFAEAGAMGIPTAAVGNYQKTSGALAFAVAGDNVNRMRAATSKGLAPDNRYTDEEHKRMTGSSK
jgi:uncharacterized protein YegL